ncbi:MAG: hypothetical protein VB099_17860 [Candidatus Limiplasma sp.]|nr:hypothetical protein [Candidatus Limiplasma sp.]
MAEAPTCLTWLNIMPCTFDEKKAKSNSEMFTQNQYLDKLYRLYYYILSLEIPLAKAFRQTARGDMTYWRRFIPPLPRTHLKGRNRNHDALTGYTP